MSERHGPELADVLRQHGDSFKATHGRLLFKQERRIWRDIETCRTAARGGHESLCTDCGVIERSYNSCRNRHCPKCRSSTQSDWINARQKDLLPVPYFHVVFTLPDHLSHLSLQNKKVIYDLLFSSASQAMLELARDKKRLGADIGFLAILHTWGQQLNHHPHLHCVVPSGGFDEKRQHWIAGNEKFFIHTKPLGHRFRNLFLQGLKKLYKSGDLELHGDLKYLEDRKKFERVYNQLRKMDWIVYAKPPFGSSKKVLQYLSGYTHRVAISNHRIQAVDDKTVSFNYKDYRDKAKIKTLTLSGSEFIRRFFLHSLPKSYTRIRYYGWMSNSNSQAALACARVLLSVPDDVRDGIVAEQGSTYRSCPHCKAIAMVVVEIYAAPVSPDFINSS